MCDERRLLVRPASLVFVVTKFTIGAVMDRSVGNTGGLGGLFGPLYAIGKGLPFREARPWKPSKGYRAFMFISKIAAKLQKKK